MYREKIKNIFTKVKKYVIILIVNYVLFFLKIKALINKGHQMHPIIKEEQVVLYKKINVEKIELNNDLKSISNFFMNLRVVYLKNNQRKIGMITEIRSNPNFQKNNSWLLFKIENMEVGYQEIINSRSVIGYVL